jgi:hypothetical protein
MLRWKGRIVRARNAVVSRRLLRLVLRRIGDVALLGGQGTRSGSLELRQLVVFGASHASG